MKIRIRLHIIGFGPIVGTLRFEQDKKATKNAIVDLSKQLKIPVFFFVQICQRKCDLAT